MQKRSFTPEELKGVQLLFPAYTKAYGIFEITDKGSSEKKEGRARTVDQELTETQWVEHLSGNPRGLGLIPILDDGENVKWGAIDIDEYPLNLTSLEDKINQLKLPLFIVRSKSGGAHCYIFLQEKCPAGTVVKYLRHCSKALGYPKAEIFPKQTRRETDPKTGKERPGNWLNGPYYGGSASQRCCFKNGQVLSLTEFIEVAEANRIPATALQEPPLNETFDIGQNAKEPAGRNPFLFAKGYALKQQGFADAEVLEKLQKINLEATTDDHPNFAKGPLDQAEVIQIASSIARYEINTQQPAVNDIIHELNQKHAVVMLGGKCVISNELQSPGNPFKEFTFSSHNDFMKWYSNRQITIGQKTSSVAKMWLADPRRRQYEGVIFAPEQDIQGFLNLYQGFAVAPHKGDCSLMLDHIQNNICKGDEEIRDYLTAWLADCVQNIARRPGISIVLRGRQGTGKSVLCEEFGKIFGPHYVHIAQASHLTGNFNAHLKDKIIVYADEAFWAGDKKAEGVLKAMITEDTLQIEMKGKDVITVQNHIRLLISSNHHWVVPAGSEERRFFVIDVGDARIQDKAYFGALINQMNNGGREAFLQYLLDYDLNGIDLRTPPATEALADQKLYSASPIQRWWLECLVDGSTSGSSGNWQSKLGTADLYNAYIDFCAQTNVKYRGSQSIFGRQLKELLPYLDKRRSTGKARRWEYVLPSLDECRRHFDLLTQTKHQWGNDSE